MNVECNLQKVAQLWQTGLPGESESGSRPSHLKSIHWMSNLPMLEQNWNKLVNWLPDKLIIW